MRRVLRRGWAGFECDVRIEPGKVYVAHDRMPSAQDLSSFLTQVCALAEGEEHPLLALIELKDAPPGPAEVDEVRRAIGAGRDRLEVRLVSFRPEAVMPFVADHPCFVFVGPPEGRGRVTWSEVPTLDPRLGVHVRLQRFKGRLRPTEEEVRALERPYSLTGWRHVRGRWSDAGLGGVLVLRDLQPARALQILRERLRL